MFIEGVPRLQRATIGTLGHQAVHEMRICDTAWLYDQPAPHPTIPIVSKRIEWITGLTTQFNITAMSSTEPFQLVNYGLGGQYEMHYDFEYVEKPIVYDYLKGSGDRVVTFMLYLTQVEAGGGTVFPHLNIRIPPIKNGAAFWFNIKPSGELDKRTEHAGCPVLLGEKWVANKWIHEYNQMFRRPCGLSPD